MKEDATGYESYRKIVEQAVLGAVVEIGRERKTWVVLDHLDDGKLSTQPDTRKLGLQVLANLVKTAPVTVKILVVFDRIGRGGGEEEVKKLVEGSNRNIFYAEWEEERREFPPSIRSSVTTVDRDVKKRGVGRRQRGI